MDTLESRVTTTSSADIAIAATGISKRFTAKVRGVVMSITAPPEDRIEDVTPEAFEELADDDNEIEIVDRSTGNVRCCCPRFYLSYTASCLERSR